MKAKAKILLIIIPVVVIMMSCTDTAGSGSSMKSLSTPIPEYVQTDQASSMSARATIVAGDASAYTARMTATAVSAGLSVQSTLVALQIAEAQATEEFFGGQTQIAIDVQATQEAANRTATEVVKQNTQIAFSMAMTADNATQFAKQTEAASTQSAMQTSTMAAVTSTALMQAAIVQATTDAYQLGILDRGARSQEMVLVFKTWFPWLAVLVIFLGIVLLVWTARYQLLAWMRLVQWGKDGKPYFIVPRLDGGMVVLDPSRGAYPVTMIDRHGAVETAGSLPDSAAQERVAMRAQAGELYLASNKNSGPGEPRRLMRQISRQQETPALPVAGQVVDVQFVEAAAGTPRLTTWVTEAEEKLDNRNLGLD